MRIYFSPILHPLQIVLRQRVGVFVAAFVFPVLQDAVGDVVQMYFCGFGGIGRAAFQDGFVDGAVLGNQLRARVFGLVEVDDAAACLAVEHFEQAAGEVAEEDVVRGVGDGLVKTHVGFGLVFQMPAFAGGFEFLPPKINPFQIGIGAPFGSQRCHAAFDVAAEIENVGFPVGMFAEQFLPALEEILLRFDGNVIAVALPRFQNLPCNQDVQRDPDRRARYAEFFRQRALGRDFAAFFVNARRDAFFQNRQYLVADFLRPNQFRHLYPSFLFDSGRTGHSITTVFCPIQQHLLRLKCL